MVMLVIVGGAVSIHAMWHGMGVAGSRPASAW